MIRFNSKITDKVKYFETIAIDLSQFVVLELFSRYYDMKKHSGPSGKLLHV